MYAKSRIHEKSMKRGLGRLVKITPETSHSQIKLTRMYNQLTLLYIQ